MNLRRNRYTYYASVADKEGYKQIRNIFIETSRQRKEHAKRFWKFLLEGLDDELPTSLEIQAEFPIMQGTTLDNLKAAASGEKTKSGQKCILNLQILLTRKVS